MFLYYVFASKANRWMLQRIVVHPWERVIWITPMLLSVGGAVVWAKMRQRDRRQNGR